MENKNLVRGCNNCVHFAYELTGNGWDEPGEWIQYCDLGLWDETELNEIEMAKDCPKYEYFDWDGHYKKEAEAEFEYFEEMNRSSVGIERH
jgi:hypothetical protein